LDEAIDGDILQPLQVFEARNAMNPSANVDRTLEARVRALEVEYARLSERLRTIGAVLGGAERATAPDVTTSESRMTVRQPVKQSDKRKETASKAASPRRPLQAKVSPPAPGKSAASANAARSPSAKKATPGAQAGGTRKWFEKGEALELFRKILQRPMPTRELMVRVIAAKRKSQLPEQDLERFRWAVHSALKEAIGANTIVRQDGGVLALASGNVRAAGKVPSKAKR
jgi:hypothetical protein